MIKLALRPSADRAALAPLFFIILFYFRPPCGERTFIRRALYSHVRKEKGRPQLNARFYRPDIEGPGLGFIAREFIFYFYLFCLLGLCKFAYCQRIWATVDLMLFCAMY